MTGDHDHETVRELLPAWAFGALQPADEHTIRPHLAECDTCRAEAERLRETVRMLDGPPADLLADGGAGGPVGGSRPVGVGEEGGVLALALRSRRPVSGFGVAPYAAPYAGAVSALQALLREVGAEGRGGWRTPVVHDWDVHDTVAHLIAADEPLALGLGLDPRVPVLRTPSPAEDDGGWETAWAERTAEVIAHERRRHDPGETVATWAAQAAALLGTPEARDPEPAAVAMTLTGARLPVADHFMIRAFEAWIHTDDIGRALGLAVPPLPDPHLWRLVHLAVRVLGAALGPEAPPVLFAVTGGEEWVLGSEDEPVQAELVLDPVDFCLLVGGRHTPDEVPRGESGDGTAVRNVLERAAALAWL
ncbi:maleylpyruvate isomerase family mycothiol-dependent enzyme [Streptomyces sp. ME02-8801-2C]|uniref:maleylpyruvate isomerase family mycothiol-dependent enzyme n=1 Tax=Streptomyces sp. ME02-8801-2C TaxID=3028680 RepID=UPI0029A8EFDC|nr:maleylpyruvate isomerase family mycothiol-dependent enzyme [Streptomyces sp. ME02-8801-2C]MDX3450653.1 maleylpyruvate isomerase family mycothiol-dependent enzyme [Streptomyces sp. ME02-8801-2C]